MGRQEQLYIHIGGRLKTDVGAVNSEQAAKGVGIAQFAKADTQNDFAPRALVIAG